MKHSSVGLAKYRLERAKESLDDAKILYDRGSFSSALNRAYYAMFYAASALLALKRLGTSKHSGVIALFNKEFVKNHIVSTEASKNLHKAFDLRIEGDYKDFVQVQKEDVRELLKNAEKFLAEMKRAVDNWKI